MVNTINESQRIFDLQKEQYAQNHDVSYEVRLERLRKVETLFRENYKAMISALQSDFGTRDEDMAFLGDIYSPLEHVDHALKHLKDWMKPQKKSDGFLGWLGQHSSVMHEPLGVAGVISAFNAPITLAFDPAIDALAAGNTVMLRFPEMMPATGKLMEELVPKYFQETELAVVTGDVKESKFFASLSWDLLFFTGGSATARHIMAAAAQNLTPVILELGGKSPIVVLEDADIKQVAAKTAKTRLMNGGQVCISGDYAVVPKDKLDEFVDAVVESATEIYPSILDNPQYTSVVGERSFDRLVSYVQEAEERGVKVIQVNPKNEALPDRPSGKFPLTLVIDPPDDLKVAKEEIFGPILPVLPYTDLTEAVQRINRKDKPLALYVFGKNQQHIDYVLKQTSSGGATVNDFMMHAGSHEMGFGGVGQSGMGRYKGGRVGFEAFSNAKSVIRQGVVGNYSLQFIPPIASDTARKMLTSRVKIDLSAES